MQETDDREENEAVDDVDALTTRHKEHRDLKRLRVTRLTKFRCLNHINYTTSYVERLFSKAKIALNDLRKSMAHVESKEPCYYRRD